MPLSPFYCQLAGSLLLLLLGACSEPVNPTADLPVATELYNDLQLRLLEARPGDTIDLPAGTYRFARPLSLDGTSRVTLRGAGMDRTILSFYDQQVGAEGLRITADSVTIEDLTVQDTKGDCIKVQDSRGVTLRRVRTTWSGGPAATNGGYGLYPVACHDVLIEQCEALHASDAGIYVGQSTNVVVRQCTARANVAGIEIENCINSQVYDNLAEGNTGGILVFDLPDLPQVNGHHHRVYGNTIRDNNLKNFAPAGNIVGIVPPGTGIILLAAKDVEIYNNTITGHKTFGTAIASYGITQKSWDDDRYDPYARRISIRDNTYQRKRALPDLSTDFGKLVNYLFVGKPQDIIYDGLQDTAGSKGMQICIDQPAEELRFAELDVANEFADVRHDLSVYHCSDQ